MEIGIFTKTFSRPTLGEILDAARGYGLRTVQLNLSDAGLADLPEEVDPADCDRIRQDIESRGMSAEAASGTFNMIDPDEGKRRDGLRRLGVLASACARIGVPIVTLCTGSRDPQNMWRQHPDNDSEGAWKDLLGSM